MTRGSSKRALAQQQRRSREKIQLQISDEESLDLQNPMTPLATQILLTEHDKQLNELHSSKTAVTDKADDTDIDIEEIPNEPTRECNTTVGQSTATAIPTIAKSVDDFLLSMNLGKYCEVFQKEEIDMVALNLMTEYDLMQLSLPMGPRKKILNALKSSI